MDSRKPSSPFDPSDLHGQFILTGTDEFVPAGWPSRRRGRYILATHPQLPAVDLLRADGSAAGWLLGQPIAPDAVRVTEPLVVDVSSPAALENDLYRLGGRFLAIVLGDGFERVYLDPAGSLSCVFAPSLAIVASTPSLLPAGHGCDVDEALLRLTGVPRGNAVLGFGLTPRVGVERLLPNHHLDLATGETARHWPVEPIRADRDPRDAVDVVAATVARNARAVMPDRRCYMSLTAGYDSRMMLACVKPFVEQFKFVTFAFPDRMGEIDVAVARRLARTFGLDHQVIPYREATPEQLERWLWCTGGAVAEPRAWHGTAMFDALDPSRPELTGAVGEAARASYWKELGSGGRITPELLLDAIHLPDDERLRRRAAAWLDGVPADRPMNVVDLFLIEQRVGAWSSVLQYGEAHAVAFRLYPLVHRDAIEAMLGLSDDYKLAHRFPRDIMRQRWPELLRVPFNRHTGIRHLIRTTRRRVWLLRRAIHERRGPR